MCNFNNINIKSDVFKFNFEDDDFDFERRLKYYYSSTSDENVEKFKTDGILTILTKDEYIEECRQISRFIW